MKKNSLKKKIAAVSLMLLLLVCSGWMFDTAVRGGTGTFSGLVTAASLNIGATGVLSTTAQSGTGSLCMTTSCVMTTPNIGAATATSVTTGQIIQSAATIATWKDNTGGTRASIPSNGTSQGTLNNWNLTGGSSISGTAVGGASGTGNVLFGIAPAISDPTIGGNTNVKRLRANQGTALVVGDVGSLSNFGTTASVAAVSGTDSAGTISILSNGTGQIANGSFVLTFHDGTWTTAPVCVGNRAEGNGPNTATVATSSSATTLAFNFDGAAAAGVTYIFNFICVGK